MGAGDELMVTGEVKRRAAGTQRVFAIRDRKGMHRWQEVWVGNPRIARPGEPFDDEFINAGGARPYIVEKGVGAWRWKAYTPEPGELFLLPEELKFVGVGKGHVIVNPNLKFGASPNKQWHNWQKLIDSSPKIPWMQVGLVTDRRLSGVAFTHTNNFRQACAVLSGSRAAVLQEGGLHHAAAAVGVAAVVIFGGFISPRCTGYAMHRNLFDESEEHPLGCGLRTVCAHCERAMRKITAKRVREELEEIL